MKSWLGRLIEYVTHGIWLKEESEIASRRERWFVRQFKLIIFTVRGLKEHDLALRSAALTFYTMLSIVPVAALIFAIVRGFGVDVNFIEFLSIRFPEYKTLINYIASFAEKFIFQISESVLASTSLVVLLWALVRVFGNMESALNNIWNIKKQRQLTRKISDYISVVVIAPVLFVASNAISMYLKNILSNYTHTFFLDFIFGFGSLVIMWLLFAWIYFVMPNTKVKFTGALVAGIVAGTVFYLFQIIYVYVQSGVSAYNFVYGSFAALPLFLVWLNVSWQILLFGAELSFAYQNVKHYEQERSSVYMSLDLRRKALLATMIVVTRYFVNGSGAVSSGGIAQEIDMPVSIVREALAALEEAGLVTNVVSEKLNRENIYMIARDVRSMRVADVLNRVDRRGISHIEIEADSEMQKVTEIIEDMKEKAAKSPRNALLMDLV